jgi:signal transduction histidine kinase
MSVAQVFQNSIPRWQKQANRRNLTLEVVLPQKLPAVVSNPAMLDQVLTGLIENFTRSIPAGGHIQVEVTPAGDQLKLQLQSQNQPDESGNSLAADNNPPTRKSIGQLLMFQPETGCLSLNLNVTKNLFQALGGKLIVRQRPQQGEVMTVFLPLDMDGSGIWNA